MNVLMVLGGGCLAGLAVQPDGSRPPISSALASVNGASIGGEDIAGSLAELAGSIALEEAALDALLAAHPRVRAAPPTPGEVAAEREVLLSTIAGEAGASLEQAGALLENLRSTRGLGPRRFEAHLRRNAALRRVVGNRVPTPEDVALAMRMEFGPRCRLRTYTSPSLERAVAARRRLTEEVVGEGAIESLPYRFAEAAVRESVDVRASSGGLAMDVSEDDPILPGGLRSAIRLLQPGAVSEVIGVEGGFVFALLEGRTAAVEPSEADRGRVEAKVAGRVQRLAMEAAAREMLGGAKIIVFDPALRWSWETRRRE